MDNLDHTAQLIAQQVAEIEHALANLRRLGCDPIVEYKHAKTRAWCLGSTVIDQLEQRIHEIETGDAR